MTKARFTEDMLEDSGKMSMISPCREEERAEEKNDGKQHEKRPYILFTI